MPKTPRFTDLHQHRRPYATAAESVKAGYLDRKLKALAREQRSATAEQAEKVRSITKRVTK